MSLLDSIFSNEILQEKAFGIFKKMMQDKGLDFIVLRIDEAGDMELAMYKPGEAAIVPTLTQVAGTQATTGKPVHVQPEKQTFKTKKANGKTDNKKRK